MIKYAVMTESFEFNPTKYATPWDAYWACDDHDDKRVAICDTLDEARLRLATIKTETVRFSYRLARASIAYIEEADFEMNEDGEWEFISGSDIWDYKCEEVPER